MIQDLLKAIVDSYVAPRPAVRRVIDRVDGFEGVAVIFGLAFCVSAIVIALIETAGGGSASLSSLMPSLLFSALSFVVLSVIVTGLGRLFGGRGSLQDVTTAVAWHTLVTSFISPFGAPVMTDDGAHLNLVPMLVVMLITSWPLGNFIAEAHRFRSAAPTLAVVYLLFVAPLLFLVMTRPEAM